jgi:hypothetical protein
MSLLHEYLRETRSCIEKIERYGYAESIEIKEEIRAGKQVILQVSVVLVDGSSLYIKEYVDTKYRIDKVSYGYQYLDGEGHTIFRYDNAKHKPALNMINHKHLSDGSVIGIDPPSIEDLIDEVISML